MAPAVARDRSSRAIMTFDLDPSTPNENEIPNKNYALDVARTLRYTRWFLEILGVWPMVKRNPKKWQTHASKLLIAMCSGLLAFIVIPCTLHMIFREKDTMTRIMLFGPVGFCLTNILKYFSMIYRRETIKSCMGHVEIDLMRVQTENDRKIINRNVTVGRHLTVICAIFMYTGGLSYHSIMPLWRGSEINEFNETIRPLVYPGYDRFVDSQSSPYYEIIFFTNFLSSCVMYTVTTAACNLAATFVAHACGQIEIIISRLESLLDDEIDEPSEIIKNRVDFVVKSHIRVLRLTSMIETLLREICLVEVVASVIIICLLEYYCLTVFFRFFHRFINTWNDSETIAIITYFVLLLSLSFNILIFCHIGELLKGQCSEIGKVAYMMDWYRLPGKTGLALVLILAMSNCPRKLTAGRMMELSISSFGSIIKNSVVYLNMLRTMAD